MDDELRQIEACFKLLLPFVLYLISVIAQPEIYIVYLNEFITIEWRDL